MIRHFRNALLTLVVVSLGAGAAIGQDKKEKKVGTLTNPVLWEEVDTSRLDLLNGPGGTAMRPTISRVEFIKEESRGTIKSTVSAMQKGRCGSQSMAARRSRRRQQSDLLHGLGYKTRSTTWFRLDDSRKGNFKNVASRSAPENIERLMSGNGKITVRGHQRAAGTQYNDGVPDKLGLLDLQNKV